MFSYVILRRTTVRLFREERLFLLLPVKGKVKAVYGSYNTAALRHIVLLPE